MSETERSAIQTRRRAEIGINKSAAGLKTYSENIYIEVDGPRNLLKINGGRLS
jgi:hypothetical protein